MSCRSEGLVRRTTGAGFKAARRPDLTMSRPSRRGRSGKKIDAMQVTETLAEGLKHEFQISVPASDLDAKADARLVDLKDKVRLNGFRPGKVPVSHLKKVYGRSVMAETIDQTIRDTNSQIFTERGFRLATEPKVTMPTEEKSRRGHPHRQIRSHLHGFDRGRARDPARRFQELLRSRSRSPRSPTPMSTRPSSGSPTRTAPMPPRARAPRPKPAIGSRSTSRAPSTARRSTAAPARTSRSRSAPTPSFPASRNS